MNATAPLTRLVRLGDRQVVLTALSVAEEEALGAELRKLAKATLGPGGYFAQAEASLRWLSDKGMVGVMRIAAERIAAMEATGAEPSPEMFDAARRSPAGVALELWLRARHAQPSLTLPEVQAVVTTANALDLYLQVQAVLAGGSDDPKATPSNSPSGS